MSEYARNLHFEDFSPGQVYVTAGRTISDADIVLFAGLSGDHTRIHVDEVFAKSTHFGGRVAQGMLGVSILTGLIAQLGTMDDTAMGLLELSVRFVAPMRPGDTLTARQTVAETRETSKRDRGIVRFDLALVNQDGTTVLTGSETIMVRRRPAVDAAS
ncbi:MAG: MaoC/PaaZ C-terminal domain-containing protein [Burkholderiales bacterium]